MQAIISVLQTALAVIFVFGLLIASHELGHFVVAKLSGVKVLEFALGMGPKLIGFRHGETDYSLRILPIGGYVKMLGEEEDSSDPRAVCNISPWKRILISIAGAFMNFVLAIVLFTIVIFNTGVAKPVVDQVDNNYPAKSAGIMVNDKILYANNIKIDKWSDFQDFVQKNGGNSFDLTILRGDKQIIKEIKPVYVKSQDRYLIGILPVMDKGNLPASFTNGVTQTFDSVKWMLGILSSMVRGKMSLKYLGGPVAVVKMSGEVAKFGFLSLLSFAAALSINLGIVNLIPFPALDGGWVVILLIQGITGRKIDENKIGYINLVGFIVLFGLMILVTVKDIFTIGSY